MRLRKKFLTGLLTVAMVNGVWAGQGFVANAQTVKADSNVTVTQEKDFVPGHVIVSIKQGANASCIFSDLDVKKAEVIDEGTAEDPEVYLLTLESKEKESVLDTVNELKKASGVKDASPDYFISVCSDVEPASVETPNDSLFNEQYGLQQVNAPMAWNVTTGEDVVVAVIDSGIDYNHPDLKDNIWTNPGEIPNDGIDNDGNGYVDDVHGWNCVADNNDPMDDYYHGTHVAGIIGAQSDNNIGVAGVAPNVKMVPIKFIDNDGIGTSSAAISAMSYAKANNIKLINASWSINPEDLGCPALFRKIQSSDALFVAAAGNSREDNDTHKHFPANWELDNIISVAATNSNGELAECSDWGATTVDIAAPGDLVRSTFPVNDKKGPYGDCTGTSMAAPHVTGTAALILSLHPEYTVAQLKQAILDSADYSQKLVGKVATNGILNTAKALGKVTTFQGVDYKDVYDFDVYANSFQDVNYIAMNSPVAALKHFVETGMVEGRPASNDFDVQSYRERYKDLDQQFGDNWKAYFMEYINEGKAQGRVGKKDFMVGDLTNNGVYDENDLTVMSNAMRFYAIAESEGGRCYDAKADLDFDLDIDEDDWNALRRLVNLARPTSTLGDVNEDGEITILDYTLLQDAVRSDSYKPNGDMDRDGDVDQDDLDLLRDAI